MTQDSTGAAVVDSTLFWRKIDANTPRGVKVLRINRPSGVAGAPGVIKTNEDWYTHWHPMPVFDPAEEV